MKLNVIYFASVASKAGLGSEYIEMQPEASIIDLRQQIAATRPEIAEMLKFCRFAVNQSYAFDADMLNDGDEVAVIPPVSGG